MGRVYDLDTDAPETVVWDPIEAILDRLDRRLGFVAARRIINVIAIALIAFLFWAVLRPTAACSPGLGPNTAVATCEAPK